MTLTHEGMLMKPTHFRNVRFFPPKLPGDVLLSLDADAGFRVYESHTTNGVPLLVPGQTVTNALPPSGYVYIHAPPTNSGTATLTLSFKGTGIASNYTASASVKATAFGIKFKPVTTEMDANINLYNPCGMGPGVYARYKIDVEPSSFPDNDIVWSVTQGSEKVTFPYGNTGRIVAVEGLSAGDFTLEASIGGMMFNPKPNIKGEVLHYTVVPVTVWIVTDDYGGNEAINETDLANLIGGVNWHLKQVASALTVSSINYTNKAEWLDITFTNNVHQGAQDLMDVSSNTGGLEFYFIREFKNCTTAALSSEKGIIISTAYIFSAIPAHEVGHAFGLEDIYEEMENDPMINIYNLPILSEHLPLDWGGGYYPSGTKLNNLISSLLMCGIASPNNIDIPSGHVYGIGYTAEPGLFEGDVTVEIWEKRLVNVGLDGIETRQPQHQ